MLDTRLAIITALPAAGSSATSAALDLGINGNPVGAFNRDFALNLSLPPTPSLADAHNVTVQLKHCATVGGSYVNIPGLGLITVATGAGGVGAAAYNQDIPLPPNCLGFIEAVIAVDSGGGSNVAVSLTINPRI